MDLERVEEIGERLFAMEETETKKALFSEKTEKRERERDRRAGLGGIENEFYQFVLRSRFLE